MNCHFRGLPALFGGLFLLALTFPALGQSDRELRDQNQVLQSQVQDLQVQLDAAKARIAELEAAQARVTQLEQENAALRSALRGQSAPPSSQPPPAPEKVTIDESISNASPRALFNAMADDFQQTMGDISVGDEDTRGGRRDREIYLDELDRWINAANRQFRSQFTWHVALEPNARLSKTGNEVRLRAVDPVTGTQLGPVFDVTVPRHLMDDLREAEDLGQLDVMELKGVIEPRVVRNMSMEHAGPFDKTAQRRLAPFAEFGYGIRVKSLQPAMTKIATENNSGGK